MDEFLPVCKQDLIDRNIEQLDFIIVTPDAYVDHYSFANALIGRWVERIGCTVGIIAQPNFNSDDDFKKLGKPKYAFLISAGNMDSMVMRYTVGKIPRKTDMYSESGKQNMRPKRCSIVYSNKIRQAYGNIPIIIGGMEPSLRRFAHYDYWDDKVRRSILFDSGADLLVYGMGEYPLMEIVECFKSGLAIKDMTFIDGTCFICGCGDISYVYDYVEIPSFDEVSKDKSEYAKAFKVQYYNQNYLSAKTMVQKHEDKYLVQNKPSKPLAQEDFDTVCSLPYCNLPHQMYKGDIPAFEEVKFSITASRGCIGGCAFCSLHFHQGKEISKRSKESIVSEAVNLCEEKDFKGYIHDVGGSTANFYDVKCLNPNKENCKRLCLYPSKCKYLHVSHDEYLNVLRDVRNLPSIKKVFIRSGLRFDYMIYDKNDAFMDELAKYHVSGQLRVAPEHVCDNVLKYMNKPEHAVYEKFLQKFEKSNQKSGLQQYVLPYFISSHPGCTLNDAIELALYMKQQGFIPNQVQDFYPTPGTLATCMYYTETNPLNGKKIYVAKTDEEKGMQRALLQFNKSKNRGLVKKALLKANRKDLIGKSKNCLIYE